MKKTRFYLSTALLTLGLLQVIGCGTGAKQVNGSYKVTGSAGVTVDITYAPNGANSSSTAVSQTLPWQYDFTGYESEGSYTGSYVFMRATNDLSNGAGNSSSAVTVFILENNTVFQSGNVFGGGQSVTLLGYF